MSGVLWDLRLQFKLILIKKEEAIIFRKGICLSLLQGSWINQKTLE